MRPVSDVGAGLVSHGTGGFMPPPCLTLRLDRRFAGLTPGPEVSLVSIIACRLLIGLEAGFMTYYVLIRYT